MSTVKLYKNTITESKIMFLKTKLNLKRIIHNFDQLSNDMGHRHTMTLHTILMTLKHVHIFKV